MRQWRRPITAYSPILYLLKGSRSVGHPCAKLFRDIQVNAQLVHVAQLLDKPLKRDVGQRLLFGCASTNAAVVAHKPDLLDLCRVTVARLHQRGGEHGPVFVDGNHVVCVLHNAADLGVVEAVLFVQPHVTRQGRVQVRHAQLAHCVKAAQGRFFVSASGWACI